MVLRKSNYGPTIDFLQSTADLKRYVFINLRKQIRQKMEGFGASQF